MNENNSKVIEYVLVILIALGVSYAIFAQSSVNQSRFESLEKSVKALEARVESINVDNIINEINIKGLKNQTAPVVTEPAAEEPATPELPEATPKK